MECQGGRWDHGGLAQNVLLGLDDGHVLDGALAYSRLLEDLKRLADDGSGDDVDSRGG